MRVDYYRAALGVEGVETSALRHRGRNHPEQRNTENQPGCPGDNKQWPTTLEFILPLSCR